MNKFVKLFNITRESENTNTDDTVADIDNQLDENYSMSNEIIESASVYEDLNKQIEYQQELINKPESVTEPIVNVAVEGFTQTLKRIGIEKEEVRGISNISTESYKSMNPARVLSIVHEDIRSVGNSILETIKKLFEMLKRGITNLVDWIINLFKNYSGVARKMIDKVEKEYDETTLVTYEDYFKSAGHKGINKDPYKPLFAFDKKYNTAIKAIIGANNELGKLKSANESDLDEKIVEFIDHFVVKANFSINLSDPTYESGISPWLVSANKGIYLDKETENIRRDVVFEHFKEPKITGKIKVPAKNEILRLLKIISDNTVNKQLQELKKVSNNFGVLESTFGKYSKISTNAIKMMNTILGKIPQGIARLVADDSKTIIMLAKAGCNGSDDDLKSVYKRSIIEAKDFAESGDYEALENMVGSLPYKKFPEVKKIVDDELNKKKVFNFLHGK